MVFKSGFGSNAKMVLYNLPETEGEPSLYALTPRQVKALLSNTDYLAWKTRHSHLPADLQEQNSLDKWVSELNLKLMTPIEASMTCEQIINCMQTDADVQAAIVSMLLNNSEFVSKLANDVRALTANELGRVISNLGSGCDINILWAECTQIVEYTHDAVVDLLQVLEVQFNNFEAVQFVEMVPGIGTIWDESQADVFVDFVNYMQETIIEQYDAQWDETIPDGIKWIMICKLFCICKDDCIITIERISQAYAALLAPYGTLSLDNVSEFVETLIGINDNSVIVPVLTHSFMWGLARLTSHFGLEPLSVQALKIILKIADNDANDDWKELCDECPTTEECYNLTAYTSAVSIISSQGLFVSGYGIRPYEFSDGSWRFSLSFINDTASTDTYSRITLVWSQPVTNIILKHGTDTIGHYNGAPNTTIMFTGSAPNWPTDKKLVRLYINGGDINNSMPYSVFLKEVCFEKV